MTLDTTGLLCPLPLIRAQDLAKELAPGSSFLLLASDPGVYYDIPAWCRMHGHEMFQVEESSQENVIQMWIKTAETTSRSSE
ncbi:MAG: sulfurtransferase TusA family protein [Gammaproteobacteria bacterium]|nr:sulfurtransferase TusA family protein [Gammaproteobacteria bacterium]MYF01690.1 sulfurtransferase TusA family protein [Gammaproteobacteria bacterium]MYI78283.1 sulfurtransferase TusA family protein [Gammaproteobacteria bacterium]